MAHLGEVKGLFWKRDECLEANPIDCLKTSIDKELQVLKSSVEEMKHSISVASQAPKLEPKSFADAVSSSLKNLPTVKKIKSKDEYGKEIRISGIPELMKPKSSDIDLKQNERPSKSDIFAHDEKYTQETLGHIGLTSGDEIASINRLGKYNPKSKHPRSILVKLKNEYIAEKALAHAASLKSFEGKYEGNKFKVYISRSLTPQERDTENAILKKRRELISSGCDPSHLLIKNLELYQDGKKVDIPISV